MIRLRPMRSVTGGYYWKLCRKEERDPACLTYEQQEEFIAKWRALRPEYV